MWEKRSKRLAVSALLAAAFVYGQMVLFLISAVFHVRIPLNLFRSCLELLRFIGFPVRMNLMIFLLGSTLLLTIAIGLREAFAALRWRRKERKLRDRRQSLAIGRRHGLAEGELSVLTTDAAIAMTVGMRRPRIVLSTGLIARLSETELRAVVAHERCHQRCRHPLALFALSATSLALWYAPIYRWVSEKYKLMIELAADRDAVKATGGVSELGGALLVMLKNGSAAAPAAMSSVSFADNAINARLKLLLDPQFRPSLRPPLLPCVVSALAFLFVAIGA